MQQKMNLDQEALNDAGLIALPCQTEKEIEEHGESNQPNLLLRDFVGSAPQRYAVTASLKNSSQPD